MGAADAEDRAPDPELDDPSGRRVRLSSFWTARPTVILFLRHFGCPCCRKQLVEVQRNHRMFQDVGAQVVAVAQGTAQEAEEFRRRLGIPFPCLGDPERESYGSYGLSRGGWKEIVLDLIRTGNLAPSPGKMISVSGSFRPHGDWFQLPGVAIVDRHGKLRYLYRSRHAGDLPPICALVDVIEGLEPDAR
jgi:peroxiredoxin